MNPTLIGGFTPAQAHLFDILQPGGGTLSGIFTGLPEASPVLGGNGLFIITYQGVSGHDVVLASMPAMVWSGADAANSMDWSDGANWVGGKAPAADDSLIFPAFSGNPEQSPNNDFSGSASA